MSPTGISPVREYVEQFPEFQRVFLVFVGEYIEYCQNIVFSILLSLGK